MEDNSTMWDLTSKWKATLKNIHEDRYRKDQLDKLLITDARFIVLDYINTPYWRGALILDRKNKVFMTSGISIWKVTEERAEKFEIIQFIDKKRFFGLWNQHQKVKLIE